MIRQCREVHRLWWPIAGLGLGALILAGVLLRQAPFLIQKADRPDMGSPLLTVQFEAKTLAGVTLASVKALAIDDGFFLALDVAEPLRKPDVLAYWQAPENASLKDAWLLGSLGGGPRLFPIPRDQTRGRLVLFSLAHGEALGQADLDFGSSSGGEE